MQKPKLAVISPNYPNIDNRYANAFIHSRLKKYNDNFNIQVLCFKPNTSYNEEYIYEGIKVYNYYSINNLKNHLSNFSPNKIAIHFPRLWLFDIIQNCKCPIFIWIHGLGAIGWYRRLFDMPIKPKRLVKYIINNSKQLFFMHKLIKYANRTGKITFIFVSKWIYRITRIDAFSKIKNYKIIPNLIDENLFIYNEKNAGHRKKILLIRSFNSKKYANDIAINAIKFLSKTSVFHDIEITIYGEGKYFYRLTNKIKHFKNVKLFNSFIENCNIPEIHYDYGIFLCPTRQDTHGVSACEAMSSGLVPITSNNSAVPEYIKHLKTGYLAKSAIEISNAIIMLYKNPELFLQLSKSASADIIKKCGNRAVIDAEIRLLLNQ